MSNANYPLLEDRDLPMGKERRKFIVLCVFDFVSVTILWLLTTVTKGSDWPTIFLREINIFEADFLQVSLFDIVLLGLLRTILLLIFYAGFRVDHWLPVAFTTSISTIFIVIKILFFFKKNHSGFPQIVLLASLTLSWLELWIVPFRILSRERRGHDNVSVETSSNSQAQPRLLNRNNRRYRRRLTPQSDDEFRSALEYTTDEERSPRISLNPTIILPGYGCIMRQSVYAALDDAYKQVNSMMSELPTWKIMNKSPEIRNNNNNIFYVRHELEYDPRIVFLASWRDIEIWNPQVVSMNYLYKFDAERDIVHSESSPALAGYISSRHFIDVRRVIHDKETNTYTCIYVSIPTPEQPEEITGGVRGTNGPNMVRISGIDNGDKKSLFEFIMNTDVKTQVPRTLMRRGIISFLSSYPLLLSKHIAGKIEYYSTNNAV